MSSNQRTLFQSWGCSVSHGDQSKTSSDKKKTTSNQRKTTSDWTKTTADKRKTTSNWSETTSDQRKTTSNWAETTSDQRKTTSNWSETTSDQRKTTSNWAKITSDTSNWTETTPDWTKTSPAQAASRSLWAETAAAADDDDDVMLVAVCEAERALQAGSEPGFDPSAGRIWIYPTNLPVREYQLRICEAALLRNSLVCLPTGLGKTFIAAVLMYNYYRWFPAGKIVFMAPTKPLVAQQIQACYGLMGIPQPHMAELTGSTAAQQRRELWRSRRVFFLTPQVMVNDLSRNSCPANQVKCVVIDEAHKATGNHAYCQVVRELSKQTQRFRILALSATPGGDVKAVQQVISNLLISHIELRSEDSPDVQTHVHQRRLEKLVVPLGESLTRYQKQYQQVLEKFTSRLTQMRLLSHRDLHSLTKYQIILSREQFRRNPPPHVQGPQQGPIEGDFALCISLYHGYELLQQMGLRSLFLFIQNIFSGPKESPRMRSELQRTPVFMELYREMETMFTSSSRGPQEPYVYSHPKLQKLDEVVLQHFQTWADSSGSKASAEVSTRVMIFSSFRESVQEIAEMLNRHQLVRVMTFMGQASAGKGVRGFTQKEQLEVVRRFREGGFNTLVSTCVGEEGLDIGEVDLIVCFDAQKSPIRLVQRMGRTGRRRQGRIVVILAEGREERTYNQSQSNRRSINKSIMGNKHSFQMFPDSPRMLPAGVTPTLHKMHISCGQFEHREAGQHSSKGRRSSLNLQMTETCVKDDGFLSVAEEAIWTSSMRLGEDEAKPVFRPTSLLTFSDRPEQEPCVSGPVRELSLWEWRHWQNGPLHTHSVGHSERCLHFTSVMELIDRLRQEEQGDCESELMLQRGDGGSTKPNAGKIPGKRRSKSHGNAGPYPGSEDDPRRESAENRSAENRFASHDRFDPERLDTFSDDPERLDTFPDPETNPEPLQECLECLLEDPCESSDLQHMFYQPELNSCPKRCRHIRTSGAFLRILASVRELLSGSPPVLPEEPVPDAFPVTFNLVNREHADPGALSPGWDELFDSDPGDFRKAEDLDESVDLFDDEAFLQLSIPDIQTPPGSDGKELGSRSDGKELRSRSDGKELGSGFDGKELGSRSDGKELGSGFDGKRLGSGSDGKQLGSGSDGKQLGSGSDGKELGSASDGKELGSGSDGKELGSASDGKELGSGSDGKQLGSASDGKRLGSGSDGKQLGLGSDGKQLGSGSDGKRLGLGSDGKRLVLGSDGKQLCLGSDGKELGSASDGKELGSGSDGKQLGSASDGKRLGSGSDGKQLGLGSDGKRLGLGSDGKRLGLGSDGKRLVLGSDGKQLCLGSDGKQLGLGSDGKQLGSGSDGKQLGLGSDGKQLGSGSDGKQPGSGSDQAFDCSQDFFSVNFDLGFESEEEEACPVEGRSEPSPHSKKIFKNALVSGQWSPAPRPNASTPTHVFLLPEDRTHPSAFGSSRKTASQRLFQQRPASGVLSSDSEDETPLRTQKANPVFSPEQSKICSDMESPVQARRKRIAALNTSEESDGDFQDVTLHQPSGVKPRHRRKLHVLRGEGRKFLDEEAELSVDEEVSSDEEDGDEQNHSLQGFVVNSTQCSQGLNDSEMQAFYLKSVKSPAVQNRVRMTYRPKYNEDIFSQVPEQDETYAEDSFVVNGSEDESGGDEEPVELMAEDSFVDGRKQYATRRRARIRRAQPERTKRSRIIRIQDSSEEEEEGQDSVFKVPQCLQSVSRRRPEQDEIKRQRLSDQAALSEELDFHPEKQVAEPIRIAPAADAPLRVLVDSRCISGGSEVVSALRLRHGLEVHVCSLVSADFIVSNRMAVEWQSRSEVAGAQNRSRLQERIQRLQATYERVCLIIQSDRSKPGEAVRVFQRSRYYDGTLAALVKAGVRLLVSNGPEETATLLTQLTQVEGRKGQAIRVPLEVRGHRQQALQFCLSLPHVSYISALNMCHHYSSVGHMIRSSVQELQTSACVSRSRAEDIYRCLRYSCC
ncbi:Fanconi anemia group M protein isoform X2 [Pseudorasbora parva]|uniref:Fanconi anemia group M protein isoform X2 n=1 Tax=Pseudorasbora parva TaxID=51549 RepID=UPI00351EEF39